MSTRMSFNVMLIGICLNGMSAYWWSQRPMWIIIIWYLLIGRRICWGANTVKISGHMSVIINKCLFVCFLLEDITHQNWGLIKRKLLEIVFNLICLLCAVSQTSIIVAYDPLHTPVCVMAICMQKAYIKVHLNEFWTNITSQNSTLVCPTTTTKLVESSNGTILLTPIYDQLAAWPRKQSSWGQHGAHLGPVGPRWAPCWHHEPCYQGDSVACDNPREGSSGMHTRNNGCYWLSTLHADVARICGAPVIGIGCNRLHFVGLTDLNTLRPRQNGRHFANYNFTCIFVNKNVWIPIKMSLRYISKGPIHNIPTLVQIMAWRHPGDKPLSKPMMFSLLTHMCVTRPLWVNALRPRQNCLRFEDDIFIVLNENKYMNYA